MKTIKAKDFSGWSEVPENFTGIVEWPNRDKFWLQNGLIHKLDGPAIEWAKGTKDHYILDQFLTKNQFGVFQFLWENTDYKKTDELMELFVELAKMK